MKTKSQAPRLVGKLDEQARAFFSCPIEGERPTKRAWWVYKDSNLGPAD